MWATFLTAASLPHESNKLIQIAGPGRAIFGLSPRRVFTISSCNPKTCFDKTNGQIRYVSMSSQAVANTARWSGGSKLFARLEFSFKHFGQALLDSKLLKQSFIIFLFPKRILFWWLDGWTWLLAAASAWSASAGRKSVLWPRIYIILLNIYIQLYLVWHEHPDLHVLCLRN